MEQITPEIKQRIFALYWGQRILRFNIWSPNAVSEEVGAFTSNVYKDVHLEVNSLSSITDEDCEKVHRMYGRRGYKTDDGTIKGMIKSLSSLDVSRWDYFSIEVWDYLRSKGYALPALGFSVNHLVAQGVFKIKEVVNNGQ